MEKLTYPFSAERFGQAVNYLLAHSQPCTHGKLCKLIYLVDRYHVVRYGRAVIGGAYNALPYGPVPSIALDVLEDLATSQEEAHGAPQVSVDLMNRLGAGVAVSVEGRYPVFSAKPIFDHPELSESDKEAIESVARTYGHLSWGQLVELTHQHVAWKDTPQAREIDYRLFFLDEPGGVSGARDYLELFQEDREAAQSLSG